MGKAEQTFFPNSHIPKDWEGLILRIWLLGYSQLNPDNFLSGESTTVHLIVFSNQLVERDLLALLSREDTNLFFQFFFPRVDNIVSEFLTLKAIKYQIVESNTRGKRLVRGGI